MNSEFGTDAPQDNMKIIPTGTPMSDDLLRYTYKVAWWAQAEKFTEEQERFIKQAYIKGSHPKRTAQELPDPNQY